MNNNNVGCGPNTSDHNMVVTETEPGSPFEYTIACSRCNHKFSLFQWFICHPGEALPDKKWWILLEREKYLLRGGTE